MSPWRPLPILWAAWKQEIKVPYGVNVVMNPLASLDLAAATGAYFIRSAFTGAYMGEYGVFGHRRSQWCAAKRPLGLDNLKMLYKVNPESDCTW